jgi:hypothetical protein
MTLLDQAGAHEGPAGVVTLQPEACPAALELLRRAMRGEWVIGVTTYLAEQQVDGVPVKVGPQEVALAVVDDDAVLTGELFTVRPGEIRRVRFY